MSDYLSAFMLLRLIIVIKVILKYQVWNNFSDFEAICEEHNIKPSIWLNFKVVLMKKSGITVFIMFLVLLFIFVILILLTDVEEFLDTAKDRSDTPLFLATYEIIITLTTVGYGDITSSSTQGRIIIMICSLLSGVVISFVVLVVSNVFSLTKDQEQACAKIDLQLSAAKVL